MRQMTTVVTVALVVLTAMSAWADDDVRREPGELANPLRGAWAVTHKPGEGGPPPFEMLMVFTRDGGVVQTDAGPPNPLQFSPGIGEWKRSGSKYQIGYTQLEFDAGQNHIGVFRALMEVSVDDEKKTMTGTVRVRFYDLSDTLLFEGEGTVEGRRLSLE